MDHIPVIERMAQRELPLGHHLVPTLLAIREGNPVLHHLSAARAWGGDLGRVGVPRDEDEGGQPDDPRGQRTRLRVIAGADRDHAVGTRAALHQRQHRIERAPRLERPRDLKALRLQAQVRAEVRAERRRAAHVRTDALRRSTHLIGVLVQKSAHAAAGSFSVTCFGLRARTVVSTLPVRITTTPMMIGTGTTSLRRMTPQITAVTGTSSVTPVACTGPNLFRM